MPKQCAADAMKKSAFLRVTAKKWEQEGRERGEAAEGGARLAFFNEAGAAAGFAWTDTSLRKALSRSGVTSSTDAAKKKGKKTVTRIRGRVKKQKAAAVEKARKSAGLVSFVAGEGEEEGATVATYSTVRRLMLDDGNFFAVHEVRAFSPPRRCVRGGEG